LEAEGGSEIVDEKRSKKKVEKGRACRNPTLAKVGEHHSHSQKWRLGVPRDSRKLRRRFEGSNLLALARSLCHWKGLED